MGLNKPIIVQTAGAVDISGLATKADISGLAKSSELLTAAQIESLLSNSGGGSVKSFQRGTAINTKSSQVYVDVTLSAVDVNKTVVVCGGVVTLLKSDWGTTSNYGELGNAYLLSGGLLRIFVDPANTTQDRAVQWAVIEFK